MSKSGIVLHFFMILYCRGCASENKISANSVMFEIKLPKKLILKYYFGGRRVVCGKLLLSTLVSIYGLDVSTKPHSKVNNDWKMIWDLLNSLIKVSFNKYSWKMMQKTRLVAQCYSDAQFYSEKYLFWKFFQHSQENNYVRVLSVNLQALGLHF